MISHLKIERPFPPKGVDVPKLKSALDQILSDIDDALKDEYGRK